MEANRGDLPLTPSPLVGPGRTTIRGHHPEETTPVSTYYHKLTADELARLVTIGMVKQDDADRIMAASRSRQPGQHADQVVRVPLNKAGSIEVRSIRFYGGEHSNRPYAFLAEVVSLTTNSAFSRFLNLHGLQWVVTNRIAFTY